jgi:hypothetical protein
VNLEAAHSKRFSVSSGIFFEMEEVPLVHGLVRDDPVAFGADAVRWAKILTFSSQVFVREEAPSRLRDLRYALDVQVGMGAATTRESLGVQQRNSSVRSWQRGAGSH